MAKKSSSVFVMMIDISRDESKHFLLVRPLCDTKQQAFKVNEKWSGGGIRSKYVGELLVVNPALYTEESFRLKRYWHLNYSHDDDKTPWSWGEESTANGEPMEFFHQVPFDRYYAIVLPLEKGGQVSEYHPDRLEIMGQLCRTEDEALKLFQRSYLNYKDQAKLAEFHIRKPNGNPQNPMNLRPEDLWRLTRDSGRKNWYPVDRQSVSSELPVLFGTY